MSNNSNERRRIERKLTVFDAVSGSDLDSAKAVISDLFSTVLATANKPGRLTTATKIENVSLPPTGETEAPDRDMHFGLSRKFKQEDASNDDGTEE